MGNIVVFVSVTLDGVIQAPGRPDEDRRGGFEHGGWALPYRDAVLGTVLAGGMSGEAALLFGRRTYEDFHRVWPKRKESPFSAVLDRARKYIVSRTLAAPLPWENSTLLAGDAAESVARLKQESEQDLVVLGSGELIRTLLRHGLIDEWVLLVHPLVLGSGRRLFADDGPSLALQLADVKTTTTGVVIATYRPAERPERYDAGVAAESTR